MEVRARQNRETSPERVRRSMQGKTVKPLRKVQVLYYLCRNGQLEHPHFMEVSHFANQQLRLKDFIDRLTILRGSGMPSLFSWSCKRIYKNGYVWNDLSENDVIYPAEGAEYVLKGSEIMEGCAERFQYFHGRHQNPDPSFLSRRKTKCIVDNVGGDNEDEEFRTAEEEEKESGGATPGPCCSRGVSTDELAPLAENPKHQPPRNPTEELPLDDGSPPSSSSTVSDKAQNGSAHTEDSDSGATTRSSVLLQIIACGSGLPSRNTAVAVSRRVCSVPSGRKSGSLQKGVLCRAAAAKSMNEEEEIQYMSENPRFGNPQSEEKEFFSGSIIESVSDSRAPTEPTLKKSSSYNEERSLKSGIAGERLEEEEEPKNQKAKCIPRKPCFSSSKPQRK